MDLAWNMKSAELPSQLRNEFLGHFRRSQSAPNPAFPKGIEHSNPIDSAPYVIDWATFDAAYGRSGSRRERTSALSSACMALYDRGVELEYILVGGSHIDSMCQVPHDLDCVLFYRLSPGAALPPNFLIELQLDLKQLSVDVRLVPADGPPILLAKMLGYFTLLYSRDRQSDAPKHMVLIEPPPLKAS